MDKAKIDRINELGRLAKVRELTFEEQQERAALRNEYIAYFRSEIRKEVKGVYHESGHIVWRFVRRFSTGASIS